VEQLEAVGEEAVVGPAKAGRRKGERRRRKNEVG
jgi:hypothetical protein